MYDVTSIRARILTDCINKVFHALQHALWYRLNMFRIWTWDGLTHETSSWSPRLEVKVHENQRPSQCHFHAEEASILLGAITTLCEEVAMGHLHAP